MFQVAMEMKPLTGQSLPPRTASRSKRALSWRRIVSLFFLCMDVMVCVEVEGGGCVCIADTVLGETGETSVLLMRPGHP